MESALVFAYHLRSHFSVSQPKALRSRAKDYLSALRRATCPEEYPFVFLLPLFPAEFLTATTSLFSSIATGPDQVAYLMLNHLPRSGMDFLLHIFHLFWSLHSLLSIWKTLSIITIYMMGMPLDAPASFRPISLTSCVFSFLNALFYLVYSSLRNLTPFSLSTRPVSPLDSLLLIKFCFFSVHFR